jgi:uncharacterized membrane protein
MSSSADTLVVAVFDDADVAWDTVVEARVSAASGALELEDACLVARDPDGVVHLRESSDMSPRAAAGYGGVWGLVIGAFIGFPLAAAAGGAVAGAYALKRRDLGITDDFEQTVADRLQPGTAAAVALVERGEAAHHFESMAAGRGAWVRKVELDQVPGHPH